jgi:uncharacterized protein
MKSTTYQLKVLNFYSYIHKMVTTNHNKTIIDKTALFVKTTLEGGESGHNWYHINRVKNNALLIADKVSKNNNTFTIDLLAIELGALLHDIADYKFHGGDEKIASKISNDFLKSIDVDETIINKVVDIIDSVTFKGSGEITRKLTLEAQIVQDADRLDALGAIGIARAFAYGGHKNREIYDPNQEPQINMNWEQYKNNKSSSINHFYEKLFLLKDLMNTKEARELAEPRHEYMKLYVDRFMKEWNSEDMI